MYINEKIGNSVLIKSFNLASLCSSGKTLKMELAVENDIYLTLIGDFVFHLIACFVEKVINLSVEQRNFKYVIF